MSETVKQRMQALGIELPPPTAPAGGYVPTVRTGNLVFVSGQIPRRDGRLTCIGKVGDQVSAAAAREAARLCALNVLAQLAAACDGDLERVVRCVRLNGAVNSDPAFVGQPAVIDGASELITAVFGEAGRHTRVAIGHTTRS